MRWDALFADMEAQLEAAAAQDRVHEVADLTRAERATVTLVDRLRARLGAELTLGLGGGDVLRGTAADVGPSWVLLTGGGREHLVVLAAVTSVSGLGEVVAPAQAVLRRLGLGHAVRAVARDRSLVRARTLGGEVYGRIDAVAADHLDLSVAYEDSGRPTGRCCALPFGGLQVLSSV